MHIFLSLNGAKVLIFFLGHNESKIGNGFTFYIYMSNRQNIIQR